MNKAQWPIIADIVNFNTKNLWPTDTEISNLNLYFRVVQFIKELKVRVMLGI